MNSVICWDGLTPETPLVRYLRMSAFLALLKGQLFVPSLRQLQASCDPTEGLLSSTSRTFPLAWGRFLAATEGALGEWLHPEEINSLREVRERALRNPTELPTEDLTEAIALSRGILCFHLKREEDMAMWQIYARDGVLIETNPGSLDAIQVPVNSPAHIGRIRYHKVGDDLEKDAIPLIARPYFFKLKGYEFEQEARWAVVTKPAKAGTLLPVDAKKLVRRVRFSPFMHRSEARLLAELCRPFLDTDDIKQSPSRAIDPLDQYGMPVPLGRILIPE